MECLVENQEEMRKDNAVIWSNKGIGSTITSDSYFHRDFTKSKEGRQPKEEDVASITSDYSEEFPLLPSLNERMPSPVEQENVCSQSISQCMNEEQGEEILIKDGASNKRQLFKTSIRRRRAPKKYTPNSNKNKVYCYCQEEDNGWYLRCDFQYPGCLEYYHARCVGLEKLKKRECGEKFSNCEDGTSYACPECARIVECNVKVKNSQLIEATKSSKPELVSEFDFSSVQHNLPENDEVCMQQDGIKVNTVWKEDLPNTVKYSVAPYTMRISPSEQSQTNAMFSESHEGLEDNNIFLPRVEYHDLKLSDSDCIVGQEEKVESSQKRDSQNLPMFSESDEDFEDITIEAVLDGDKVEATSLENDLLNPSMLSEFAEGVGYEKVETSQESGSRNLPMFSESHDKGFQDNSFPFEEYDDLNFSDSDDILEQVEKAETYQNKDPLNLPITVETLRTITDCPKLTTGTYFTAEIPNEATFRLTDDEWKRIEPADEKPSTLKPCWTEVVACHLNESNDYCTFRFKRHFIQRRDSRKRNCDVFTASGNCVFVDCKCSFTLKMSQAQFNVKEISVTYKGAVKHATGERQSRFIRNEERQKLAKMFQEKPCKPSKVYQELKEKLTSNAKASGNRTGCGVQPTTMRKIASEGRQNDYIARDMVESLDAIRKLFIQEENSRNKPPAKIDGFIHMISLHPLIVCMWTEGQVMLWHDRVLNDVAYLDATGTIVGDYNGKRSLYYALAVRHPIVGNPPMPVAEMVTNDHSALNIRAFTGALLRMKQKIRILIKVVRMESGINTFIRI
ncbi:uncharacterized protein LOC114520652 [Dendronephthya gigantea]|uniref:uncharacterized protein LOC114520652 n=1 Tax=Dendronephthya gigantea TaxID=151771 RepID=UPI0010695634|nr:uncharacterized protein LOC114520652 [Dendronephthya gigantea]